MISFLLAYIFCFWYQKITNGFGCGPYVCLLKNGDSDFICSCIPNPLTWEGAKSCCSLSLDVCCLAQFFHILPLCERGTKKCQMKNFIPDKDYSKDSSIPGQSLA